MTAIANKGLSPIRITESCSRTGNKIRYFCKRKKIKEKTKDVISIESLKLQTYASETETWKTVGTISIDTTIEVLYKIKNDPTPKLASAKVNKIAQLKISSPVSLSISWLNEPDNSQSITLFSVNKIIEPDQSS